METAMVKRGCPACGETAEITYEATLNYVTKEVIEWTGEVFCQACRWEGAEEELCVPAPAPTYHCPECGGDNVDAELWRNVNTGLLRGETGDDYWCGDCQKPASRLCTVTAGKCDSPTCTVVHKLNGKELAP